MQDFLELLIAQSHVEDFEHSMADAVVRESLEAQDCLDCEAHLQKGIDAFKWLERFEHTLTVAASCGRISKDVITAAEKSHVQLRTMWLKPCAPALEWARRCLANDYAVANLNEFRDCHGRALEWSDEFEEFERSRRVRDEQLNAEPW